MVRCKSISTRGRCASRAGNLYYVRVSPAGREKFSGPWGRIQVRSVISGPWGLALFRISEGMHFARLDDVVTCYKRFADETSFDTIVVGSGIGGLAVAALLAKAGGQRVLVLERHYSPGGLTHVFHRPGFEWDVGVHYVGQVHEPGSPARAWFEYLTEGRLDWQPMPDVYDRVVIGDLRFDYVRGEARLRDALLKGFPAESRVIERYFTAIHQCLRRMPFFFAEKMLPPIPSRLLGRALRAPFLSLARRTTADVLDDVHASPELRAVLTAQWGDYGLPPKLSSFGNSGPSVAAAAQQGTANLLES